MEQLSLFKDDTVVNKELLEGNIFREMLEFHDTHSMADGEFYNMTKDLDLPSLPVKTGYFAKSKDGIAICRIPPVWYYGPVVLTLAPSSELLREYKASEVTTKEYCKRFYKEVLESLDPFAVYKRLESYGFPRLLCWERSGAFCHRHLVQEWICLNLLRGGVIKT